MDQKPVPRSRIASLRERYAPLMPLQRQVMVHVASGLMNKQVAKELSIKARRTAVTSARAISQPPIPRYPWA